MTKYRIIYRKEDLGLRISALYRQKQFSIGILDFGSKEDLCTTLDWYRENMNLSLHVMTTEYRMEQYGIEDRYPEVTYIVFKNDTTTGEYINALADECYSDFFLIVRTDMEMVAFDSGRMLEIMGGKDHPVVISPVMLSSTMEVTPTLRAPYIRGREIDPLSFIPSTDVSVKENNLYPVMALGFYDRALFQRLRGYDMEIIGEYFQCIDFGVRAWLCGYSIFTIRDLAVRFPGRVSVIEDRSECPGMERFYTKALSIKRVSGKNLVTKWKPYVDKEILKGEVKKKLVNLQKTDFFTLMEKWNGNGE